MSDFLADFKHERRQAHQRLLAAVADLTDDQLRHRPGAHAPGIGFHFWHTGRWADYDRQIMGGGEQLWYAQHVPSAWGLENDKLGQTGTGTGMGDDASEQLILPERSALIAYVEAAFTAFDAFMEPLTLEQLVAVSQPPDRRPRPIQNILVTHLAHDSRHLGMIEALRGLLGLTGTATA